MILYRLLGDEKLFADFFVAKALRDQLDDFLFAIGKQRSFAARSGFGGFGEGLHDFGGHTVNEPNFPGVNPLNAFYEKFGGGLLYHNSTSAEAHGVTPLAA